MAQSVGDLGYDISSQENTNELQKAVIYSYSNTLEAQPPSQTSVSMNPPKTGNSSGNSSSVKKTVADFIFGQVIGEGSYSTVVYATDLSKKREFAVKILDKRHIIKEKKVKYVNIEKNTLNKLNNHPSILRLYCTFQDKYKLYYVLDYAKNGELLTYLKQVSAFDEESACFYCAQILDAIDYMHSNGVVHRDLKPENVLLDANFRVKIADFGTANIISDEAEHQQQESLDQRTERASSFVGTAEYVPPELLTNKNTGMPADIWAFGCIVFQLLAGAPPFKGANEYQTFQKIVKLDYQFPNDFPVLARQLVQSILLINPNDRPLVPEIKRHPFFAQIQWDTLWQSHPPPIKPRARVSMAAAAAAFSCKANVGLNKSDPALLYHNKPSSQYSSSSTNSPASNLISNTNESSMSQPNLVLKPMFDSKYGAITKASFLQGNERMIKSIPANVRRFQIPILNFDYKLSSYNKLIFRRKLRTLILTDYGRLLILKREKSGQNIVLDVFQKEDEGFEVKADTMQDPRTVHIGDKTRTLEVTSLDVSISSLYELLIAAGFKSDSQKHRLLALGSNLIAIIGLAVLLLVVV